MKTGINAVAVIPAYQAEGTIRLLVEGVRAQGLPVIVVDDASTDRTAALALGAGARVVKRQVNGGKGVALREGLTCALKEDFNWFFTLDADRQHLPEEIFRFVTEAHRGGTDFILGDRMAHPQGMPWVRRWTNRLMSAFLSRLAGQKIPDTQCGFRLISRRVLEEIQLGCDRFEIDSELVVKTAQAGFRIVSVPIRCVYADHTSFVHPIRDTFRFLRFLRGLRKSRR